MRAGIRVTAGALKSLVHVDEVEGRARAQIRCEHTICSRSDGGLSCALRRRGWIWKISLA